MTTSKNFTIHTQEDRVKLTHHNLIKLKQAIAETKKRSGTMYMYVFKSSTKLELNAHMYMH